ncbi:MAG: leucyl aminopeptidase [Candidatus Nanopelagicales bacterium]
MATPHEALHLRLQLVPLDALQALSVSAEDVDEQSALTAPVAVGAAPPNIVVTSCSPDPEGGVTAGDVGIRLAAEQRIDLRRRLRRAEATGKVGEIVEVELEDDTTETLLALGVGDDHPPDARKAGAALAKRIKNAEVVLCDVTAPMSHASLRAFCEGLLLASYQFSRKSKVSESKETVVQLAVAGLSSSQRVVDQAIITARAVCLARDLANRPSNEKNPQWLAEQAQAMAKQARLRVRVLDETALERGGFGGLLAVGGGSANPPRLVVTEYRGDPTAPRVVLVGKGITFDSGGLSLKPPDGMPTMKTDMSGAAAVLAVMSSLSDLGVTANVVGLLACAENMPSGQAYRPGDVVRHFGGRTSEVLNTDAEGRMVLADAIAYANARLRPDVIIDIATLTGAATLGLSRQLGALFTADDGLAKRLEVAGNESNDQLWRLPLATEYRSSLDSPIADIAHVSRGNVGGGAITAALFLKEFAGARRWAHLDIAGPARAEKDQAERLRGATGFGVRLLLRWLAASPDLW